MSWDALKEARRQKCYHDIHHQLPLIAHPLPTCCLLPTGRPRRVLNHWISRFDIWPYLERFTIDATKVRLSSDRRCMLASLLCVYAN